MRASRHGFKNRSARRLSNVAVGKNERKLAKNRDRETFRVKRAVQVMQGLLVQEVAVVGEQPYRDKANRLVWDCACMAAGHKTAIAHSDLSAEHGVCHVCQEPALKKSKGLESAEDFQEWIRRGRVKKRGSEITALHTQLEKGVSIVAIEIETQVA